MTAVHIILFHFTLKLLTLEHAIMTADLLNQTPTKKVMLLFQLIVANGYLSRLLNTIITDKIVKYKNHLAQKAIFHFLVHRTTMTVHSNVFENLLLI